MAWVTMTFLLLLYLPVQPLSLEDLLKKRQEEAAELAKVSTSVISLRTGTIARGFASRVTLCCSTKPVKSIRRLFLDSSSADQYPSCYRLLQRGRLDHSHVVSRQTYWERLFSNQVQ